MRAPPSRSPHQPARPKSNWERQRQRITAYQRLAAGVCGPRRITRPTFFWDSDGLSATGAYSRLANFQPTRALSRAHCRSMIRARRPLVPGRLPRLPTSSASTTTLPFPRLLHFTRSSIPTPRSGAAAARLSGQARAPHHVFSRTQKRNFSWSWSRRSQTGGAKKAGEESLSLSGRLRKLSREYGWSAVGVYLALSVLDFPFCFLLVKWAGTERIGT